jgi:MFS transporter, DHA1 family, multidrug resistance protein
MPMGVPNGARVAQSTGHPRARPGETERGQDRHVTAAPEIVPTQRPVLTYRAALLLLGTASWLGPFSLDAYAPAFPAIADWYGVSDGMVQLTLSATLVGLAVGPLLAGGLSDRRGRRRTLLTTLVLYAAASLACAVAPTIWALVAARFAQGLLAATILTTARAAARDVFEGTRLTRFYIHLAGLTAVAPLVGPLMGAQVTRVASWPWIFVGIAAATVALTVMIALFLPETAPAYEDHERVSMVGLLADRGFVLVSLTLGLAVGVGLSYVASSPFVLQDGYGLSPTAYSLLFCGNAAILITVGQVNAWLTRTVSSERILPWALGGQVATTLACTVALFTHAPVQLTCAALYLMIVTHGLCVPHLVSAGMHRAGHAPGAASSVLGVAQFSIGALLTPVLTLGGLPPYAALGVAMPVLAVLALATYVCFTRGRWRNQPLTGAAAARHTDPV